MQKLKKSSQWIQIKIVDHVPGIAEQELDKVFHPFCKVDKKLGGSGLGLAIVSHLAQAHGWHIGLKNSQEGGLIAQITLPVD